MHSRAGYVRRWTSEGTFEEDEGCGGKSGEEEVPLEYERGQVAEKSTGLGERVNSISI